MLWLVSCFLFFCILHDFAYELAIMFACNVLCFIHALFGFFFSFPTPGASLFASNIIDIMIEIERKEKEKT